MLDALHGGGVEIVSPNFMNTRPVAPEQKFIPDPAPKRRKRTAAEVAAPEDILFDKAEEAEEAEGLKERMTRVSEEVDAVKAELKDAPEDIQHELEARLVRLEKERDRLAAKVEEIRNGEKGER